MRARFWILLSALLVFGQNGFAMLWEDPSAYMSDSAPFGTLGGPLTGHVDYAIYQPGEYTGSVAFNDNLWVYAYQVFNDARSTAGIDYFSISLSPDILVPSVAYDTAMGYAVPGGGIPSMQFKLPESVIYIYLFDNIGANEYSQTLLFGSDCAPGAGKGVVFGGSDASVDVPAPVPEPATLILLFSGAFMALRGKRNV